MPLTGLAKTRREGGKNPLKKFAGESLKHRGVTFAVWDELEPTGALLKITEFIRKSNKKFLQLALQTTFRLLIIRNQ